MEPSTSINLFNLIYINRLMKLNILQAGAVSNLRRVEDE